MNKGTLLALDFDGVICDSLLETMVSSWLGYHAFVRGSVPQSAPLALRRQFYALRPFIRAGQDYLVIQDLIHKGETIRDQAGFDERSRAMARTATVDLVEAFYRGRAQIMENDFDFWLKLNPLYPQLEIAFRELSGGGFPGIIILSTKKPEYIAKILDGYDIAFPGEQVIYSGSSRKQAILSELLDREGYKEAIFIDDQIDHLAPVPDPRVKPFLAAWGYIRLEWLSPGSGVAALTIEQAAEMLRRIGGGNTP